MYKTHSSLYIFKKISLATKYQSERGGCFSSFYLKHLKGKQCQAVILTSNLANLFSISHHHALASKEVLWRIYQAICLRKNSPCPWQSCITWCDSVIFTSLPSFQPSNIFRLYRVTGQWLGAAIIMQRWRWGAEVVHTFWRLSSVGSRCLPGEDRLSSLQMNIFFLLPQMAERKLLLSLIA